MKQLVVEKNNPTPILWDTPIPNPGPGEMLIKNHYSVVSSGTELAAIEVANTSVTDKLQNSSNIDKGLDLLKKEGLGAVWNAVFPKNLLPIQLGYSSSGEVIKVGKGVSGYHVGDRVVSNGGHAEYVVVSENLCSRIDETTDIKEAAFTVLGSIALHGLRLSETTLGSKVVVIGLGVIGQLVCRLAEAQGSEVTGIDPDPERSKNRENFFTSAEEVELRDVDTVIITAATSSNEPIELATKIARNKAKIVVVGDIPLNISIIFLEYSFSFNSAFSLSTSVHLSIGLWTKDISKFKNQLFISSCLRVILPMKFFIPSLSIEKDHKWSYLPTNSCLIFSRDMSRPSKNFSSIIFLNERIKLFKEFFNSLNALASLFSKSKKSDCFL